MLSARFGSVLEGADKDLIMSSTRQNRRPIFTARNQLNMSDFFKEAIGLEEIV